MKNKKTLIYVIVAIIIVAIIVCFFTILKKSNQNTENKTNIEVAVNYKEEDLDVNWKDENYEEVTLSESINITKAGTYHLTGTLEDGSITINVGDNDLVKLVLDNVSITCSNSSAINVENARKVIITVEEGTTNTLTDGESYSTQDEPDAALFSKDTLVINGTGTLNINANYLDGIASKDGLKIIGVTINVTSNDDGIRGKDYIGIKNSSITINAGGDGLKSTNDIDAGEGYILLENSIINIEAEQDGIQAVTNVTIESGTFEIKVEDDGIHADDTININGGTIDISKSYEGIEASNIYINGGSINLIASDDGINISGGNDGSGVFGRPGQNMFSETTDGSLEINNGTILIDSSGDGIDVNGKAYINGGKVYVNGPTNDGNGALDYASTFEVNGGELIAVGASGMMQAPSNGSEIYSISYVYTSTQEAGGSITIKNSNEEEIISFTATKTYNSVVISSEKFEKGETYTIYSNDEKVEEITIEDTVTSAGSRVGGMSNMQTPQGGMEKPSGDMQMEPSQGGKPGGGKMNFSNII